MSVRERAALLAVTVICLQSGCRRTPPPPAAGDAELVRLRNVAFGARLTLTAGGRTQVREHVSGEGYFSTNAPELHFGLGAAEKIDTLENHWPSGMTETFSDLPVDRTHRFAEGDNRASSEFTRESGR